MSATQTSSAEDTIKDVWSTRPRRPRRGRKIAGVAAGIANRYRIDPVLVRVGLVVAAIYGGAGVLVYLLGWLFLPEQDDEVSPFEALIGKGRSSTSTAFTLLLCIALIPTFSWFFSGGFLPGWLGLIVVAGLLYLLHHSRGHLRPVEPTAPAPAAASPVADMPLPPMPMMPMATTESPMTATPAAPQSPGSPLPPVPPEPERTEQRTTPPAWDPLGAAPFAWDLPDPTPPSDPEPEPPVRRRKSKIGVMTVGAALVIAGGLSMGMGGWVDPQHIIGVVLAILGIGMVIGAFVRGGRGLIGLAVPLSLLGIGMTVVTPDGWHGAISVDSAPTSIKQVQPEYRGSVGDVRLDLTGLPATGKLETDIDLDAGDVEVILPPTADVELKCETKLGEAKCLNHESTGSDNELPEIEDLGTDLKEGGLKIDMKVEVGTGTLEVRRG